MTTLGLIIREVKQRKLIENKSGRALQTKEKVWGLSECRQARQSVEQTEAEVLTQRIRVWISAG